MDARGLPGGPVPARKLFFRRLGAFAWAHYCYSIACLLLGLFFVGMLSALAPLYWNWPNWLLEGLFGWLLPWALMGGYALLGYWCGGKNVWPTPFRGRDFALSVLAEAAIAWCWAALVIWLFASADFMEPNLFEALFPTVFFLSFLGAFPSSAFVVMGLGVFVGLEGVESLVFMGFLAGLLPPLLFHLGSFWRAQRAAGPDKIDAQTIDP